MLRWEKGSWLLRRRRRLWRSWCRASLLSSSKDLANSWGSSHSFLPATRTPTRLDGFSEILLRGGGMGVISNQQISCPIFTIKILKFEFWGQIALWLWAEWKLHCGLWMRSNRPRVSRSRKILRRNYSLFVSPSRKLNLQFSLFFLILRNNSLFH